MANFLPPYHISVAAEFQSTLLPNQNTMSTPSNALQSGADSHMLPLDSTFSSGFQNATIAPSAYQTTAAVHGNTQHAYSYPPRPFTSLPQVPQSTSALDPEDPAYGRIMTGLQEGLRTSKAKVVFNAAADQGQDTSAHLLNASAGKREAATRKASYVPSSGAVQTAVVNAIVEQSVAGTISAMVSTAQKEGTFLGIPLQKGASSPPVDSTKIAQHLRSNLVRELVHSITRGQAHTDSPLIALGQGSHAKIRRGGSHPCRIDKRGGESGTITGDGLSGASMCQRPPRTSQEKKSNGAGNQPSQTCPESFFDRTGESDCAMRAQMEVRRARKRQRSAMLARGLRRDPSPTSGPRQPPQIPGSSTFSGPSAFNGPPSFPVQMASDPMMVPSVPHAGAFSAEASAQDTARAPNQYGQAADDDGCRRPPTPCAPMQTHPSDLVNFDPSWGSFASSGIQDYTTMPTMGMQANSLEEALSLSGPAATYSEGSTTGEQGVPGDSVDLGPLVDFLELNGCRLPV